MPTVIRESTGTSASSVTASAVGVPGAPTTGSGERAGWLGGAAALAAGAAAWPAANAGRAVASSAAAASTVRRTRVTEGANRSRESFTFR